MRRRGKQGRAVAFGIGLTARVVHVTNGPTFSRGSLSQIGRAKAKPKFLKNYFYGKFAFTTNIVFFFPFC